MAALGYQWLPLSKPVVGQNIALDMLCLITGLLYLPSIFLIKLHFLKMFNGGMCSESEFVLVVGIQSFQW